MKLKDVYNIIGLDEMSLPIINTPEKAVVTIREIYNNVIKGKEPEGDFIGRLNTAVKTIRNSTAPEKYRKEIQMAIEAKKKIMSYSSKVNPHQAVQTANKGLV